MPSVGNPADWVDMTLPLDAEGGPGLDWSGKVPLKTVEGVPSVLTGRLGYLIGARSQADGRRVALVRVPQIIGHLFSDLGIRIRTEWQRGRAVIRRALLIPARKVSPALFATFAAAVQTPRGNPMPKLTDPATLVVRDLPCDSEGGPRKPRWRGEVALQALSAPSTGGPRELGTLKEVWADSEGQRFAKVLIPQWLAGLIDAGGVRARCQWSRDGREVLKAFLLSSTSLQPARFSADEEADDGTAGAERWAAWRNATRGRPSGGVHRLPEQQEIDLGDGEDPSAAFSDAQAAEIEAWVVEARASAEKYAERQNRCRTR